MNSTKLRDVQKRDRELMRQAWDEGIRDATVIRHRVNRTRRRKALTRSQVSNVIRHFQ